MGHRTYGSALLFAGVAAAACGGRAPEPSAATVRDSAGVLILEQDVDRLYAMVPEPLVAAPFPVAPPELGDIADVAISDDGRLVILDPLGPNVVVLDSTGAQTARLGREGTGPGEFRGSGLWEVVVVGDTILVPDVLNRRAILFGIDGERIRSFSIRLEAGLVVDWQAIPGGGVAFRRRSDPQRLEQLDEDVGRPIADLAMLDLPATPGPLAPVPLWCVLPDRRLVIGRADRYRLLLFNGSRHVGIVRVARPPEPLRDEQIGHVRDLMLQSLERIPAEQVSSRMVEQMLSGVVFPEHAPQIAGLACPSDDEIWVQRAIPVLDMGRDVLRVGSARAFGGPVWDVWNVRTGSVRPVTVADHERITRITDGVIAGYSMDALGRKTVIRWRRPGLTASRPATRRRPGCS